MPLSKLLYNLPARPQVLLLQFARALASLSIFLSEKDYFPDIDDIDEELEFAKWFYYYQGQYHAIKAIIANGKVI